MTVAELLVSKLHDAGTRAIFGVPGGGSNLDVIEAARRHVANRLPPDTPPLLPRMDGKPFVFLVVGINGVGKTTSCAKLAHWLQRRGQPTVLAAADTFRAAAVEQLERWGQRLSIPVVKGQPNADPSSVCFNAHQKAIADGSKYLICDTAGRLHTRHNLMEELSKIRGADGVPSADELAQVKGGLVLGRWQALLDGARAASATYAVETVRYVSLDRLAGWPEAVERVAAEAVRAAAVKYIQPDRLAAVIIGQVGEARAARHPRWPFALDDVVR